MQNTHNFSELILILPKNLAKIDKMLKQTRQQKIKELLTRGVENVIERKSLLRKLHSSQKLRIKHGVDPTGPRIHLGRAIQLWKLREFQELGHQVVIIIGDFTAQIGDASDKTAMRKPLSKEEVEKNLKDYKYQIGKILDLKKVEFHRNSEWLANLSLQKLLPLAMKFTAQQMIQRRNFKERWEKAKPIGVHELLYPILQGYDSLQIKADVEIGGTDQLFNLKVGRDIQRLYGQSPQDIMTTKMLYGLDQRKMSTSWGNTLNITAEPEKMYGKIMSMKDELIGNYFELATRTPLSEVKKIEEGLKLKKLNPRDAKAKLAKTIIALYYSQQEAEKAELAFRKIFQEKKLPSKMPIFRTSQSIYPIVELLCKLGLAGSHAEGKRLITQKGVKINGKIEINWRKKIKLSEGTIIQVGKRRFRKIKLL